MFKKVTIIAILFSMLVNAHSILLMVEDNGDGTIYIETGLSTGRVPEGASLVLKEKSNGRPLFSSVIPKSGTLLKVKQPTVPYTVTITLSEGHSITKDGILAPVKKKIEKKSNNIKKDTMNNKPEEKHEEKPKVIQMTLFLALIAGLFGFVTTYNKRKNK